MAYLITEECNNCGLCEAECPDEAISSNGDIYMIDAEICSECDTCIEICFPKSIVKLDNGIKTIAG